MKKLLFAIMTLSQFTFFSCSKNESDVTHSIYCSCKYGSLGHDASFFLYEEGEYISFTEVSVQNGLSTPATTINGEKKECLRYVYYRPNNKKAAEMKLVSPGRYVIVCNPKNKIFLVRHIEIGSDKILYYFECDVNKALKEYYTTEEMIILDWVDYK